MTLSQKQRFPEGHFPIPASAANKSRYFYFWYNTRDDELRWLPIKSIFSPSPMGKEKLMGISNLGLFVLKDSKEVFLKISNYLEYCFSLWRVNTKWKTLVICKWVTEIKDLRKIMCLTLVSYVSRLKQCWVTLGNQLLLWALGSSLAKRQITRSPSTLNHPPISPITLKANYFFYWRVEVGEKRKIWEVRLGVKKFRNVSLEYQKCFLSL